MEAGLLRKTLEAVLIGAGVFAGTWLMQELRDPYSDLRLRGAELVDRLREVKR